MSSVKHHSLVDKSDVNDFRTLSWHVSQEIERQQDTLQKHIADSQETSLNVSSELAAQKSLMQKNTSWAQRLNNLLSGCVVDPAQTLKVGPLSLSQLFAASSCPTRRSSWQDMDYGQADNRHADTARKEHSIPGSTSYVVPATHQI